MVGISCLLVCLDQVCVGDNSSQSSNVVILCIVHKLCLLSPRLPAECDYLQVMFTDPNAKEFQSGNQILVFVTKLQPLW